MDGNPKLKKKLKTIRLKQKRKKKIKSSIVNSVTFIIRKMQPSSSYKYCFKKKMFVSYPYKLMVS